MLNNNKGSTLRKYFSIFVPPTPGFSFRIIDRLFWKHPVHPKYYPKVLGSYLLNFLNAPFRGYERTYINPKIRRETIENPPVFIIGHWRSGTTHLHNLVTRNPEMAYVTTFQSLFPNNMVNKVGRTLFMLLLKLALPPNRLADSVELDPEYPEEEEFTLGMKVPVSYYFFWLFPKQTKEFYKRYIEFAELSPETVKEWGEEYSLLIKKAIRNTKGKIFISKNPPNTGRIPQLLKLFPDARFIFIHRNPAEVYSSTLHFLRQLLPKLTYHTITDHQIEENMIYVYRALMKKYLNDRDQVPPRNLYEMRYDDLMADPVREIENIYLQFNFPERSQGMELVKQHLEETKEFSGNKLKLTNKQRERVKREFGFAFGEWGYPLPK
ncbi:MAG: sulfotransferase [Bacteroidales bacterium]|nr:sulfotransferase [Bacteroidota bacterium]MBL6949281.1 sulfotransferase [Bacteroidales bacterium]